jgi:hypothetical protein
MALASRELAKTTARVGTARMGTARMGFRPRNTTTHVPGSTRVDLLGIKRYYVWGRLTLPDTAPTLVLS